MLFVTVIVPVMNYRAYEFTHCLRKSGRTLMIMAPFMTSAEYVVAILRYSAF